MFQFIESLLITLYRREKEDKRKIFEVKISECGVLVNSQNLNGLKLSKYRSIKRIFVDSLILHIEKISDILLFTSIEKLFQVKNTFYMAKKIKFNNVNTLHVNMLAFVTLHIVCSKKQSMIKNII